MRDLNIKKAIIVIVFFVFVVILYFKTKAKVETTPAYRPYEKMVLTDTTDTWPEPDSSFVFNGTCVTHTYTKKTLAKIDKKFNL